MVSENSFGMIDGKGLGDIGMFNAWLFMLSASTGRQGTEKAP